MHDNSLPWFRKLGNLAHEYAARAGDAKEETCADATQVLNVPLQWALDCQSLDRQRFYLWEILAAYTCNLNILPFRYRVSMPWKPQLRMHLATCISTWLPVFDGRTSWTSMGTGCF